MAGKKFKIHTQADQPGKRADVVLMGMLDA